MTEANKPRNRKALITGASVGIGRAFAECLARDGYDLIVVARGRERLDELAARLQAQFGVKVDALPADLTDDVELRAVEAAVDGEEIDLLVNNAGFGTVGPFADADVDHEEEEIRLNVVALVRLTRAALPGMLERGHGAVINVSSLAAFQPNPFGATYGATKAFVNSFSEAVAEELRGSGVRVMAVCPGFTHTEFQKRAKVDTSSFPEFIWMQPEAVAESALAALARGDVVSVPGLGNQIASVVTSILPRSILRRIGGATMRRMRT